MQLAAEQKRIVGLGVARAVRLDGGRSTGQLQTERRNDRRGDLILDLEHVLELTLEGLGPELRPGVGANELRRDSQAIPERRTLPSSTFATLSFAAMVGMSSDLPLNEKEEVRAITLRPGVLPSCSISSSARPSEKYSWSFFSLMSANESTTTDLSLTNSAFAGAVTGASAVGVACFDERNLPARKEPMPSINKPITTQGRTERTPGRVETAEGETIVAGVGFGLGDGLGDGVFGEPASGAISRRTCPTKASRLAPAARRVHCTSRN